MRSETEVLAARAGERRQDFALASLRLQHFPDSYTYFIDFAFKLAFSSDRVVGPILIVRTLSAEKENISHVSHSSFQLLQSTFLRSTMIERSTTFLHSAPYNYPHTLYSELRTSSMISSQGRTSRITRECDSVVLILQPGHQDQRATPMTVFRPWSPEVFQLQCSSFLFQSPLELPSFLDVRVPNTA